MTALYSALTLLLFAGPLAAIVWPRARTAVAALLAVAAVGLAVEALRGAGTEASLTVTHAFAAYEGQEIASKRFVVDEVTAPGWQWALPCLIWAAGWATWSALRRDHRALPSRPLAAPLALAWGGCALLIALQKTAAPAPVALGLDISGVPPFEAALLPAILAAALQLAKTCPKVLHVVLYLSLFVALAHLPLAIGGTIATQQQLGTYLDVHRIELVANPFNQSSMVFEPGSSDQLTWLIWTPQLLLWPAFAMLSAGGAGFAAFMFAKQARLAGR